MRKLARMIMAILMMLLAISNEDKRALGSSAG